jgi:hypothetical protein
MMQYYGGPQNGVFDTQNTIAQLKCQMDDLQQIVNQISPGSVPITGPNSTHNISLPISATDVTWFDQSNGDTHSVQQALQTTNTRVSSLESGSNSNSSSNTEITLPLSTADVNCTDSDNKTTDLQTRLNFLYLQILNPQSSSGSGSSSDSGGGSLNNIILPLLSHEVSYYSNINSQSYSLSVFLNSLELKIIDLQNRAPVESGSGLSIDQEEKLDIIGIPHSTDNRLFLDPAYSIQYLQTEEYKDPVLNFTNCIRLQQRDPYLPIDIKYNNSIGALVIKMNMPTIILPNQFQVRFDYTEDTISFIRPGFPYDTTDKYYKATLKFGSDSQNISSSNVNHNGSTLSGIINSLQADVEELKTQLTNLNTEQINHYIKKEDITKDLRYKLGCMFAEYNTHTLSNGNTVEMPAFLNYLDAAVIQCFKKANGESVGLPVMPPTLTPQEVIMMKTSV